MSSRAISGLIAALLCFSFALIPLGPPGPATESSVTAAPASTPTATPVFRAGKPPLPSAKPAHGKAQKLPKPAAKPASTLTPPRAVLPQTKTAHVSAPTLNKPAAARPQRPAAKPANHLPVATNRPALTTAGARPGATVQVNGQPPRSFPASAAAVHTYLIHENAGSVEEVIDGVPTVLGANTAGLPYTITITGIAADDEQVTVDFTSLVANLQIGFDGGGGGADTLTLLGTTAGPADGAILTESLNATGPGAGQFLLNFTASAGNYAHTVTFSNIGLAPVNDLVLCPLYQFSSNGAGLTFNVGNGAVVNAAQTLKIDSGATNAFTPTQIANKAQATVLGTNTGTDVMTLNNTLLATGVPFLLIDSGGASDTVNVQQTPAGLLTLLMKTNGIPGDLDTVTIGNAGLTSGILGGVNVANVTGHTSLTIDDSADTTPRTIGSTSALATGLAPVPIGYSALDINDFTIRAGSGGNTITVLDTICGLTPTTLYTGTGNDNVAVQKVDICSNLVIHGQSGTDTVVISDTAPTPGGTLDQILGGVSVDNTSGFTALTVDDSGSLSTRTITLTSSQITGFAGSTIAYAATDISTLTLNGSNPLPLSGIDTFTINGTPNFLTQLNTGPADNDINVMATTAGSSLYVHGSGGNDVATVGSQPSGIGGVSTAILGAVTFDNPLAFTDLLIDNSGDTVARTVTVTDTSVTGLAPATITYASSDIGPLYLQGGAGGNTFNVVNTVNTAFGAPTYLSAGPSGDAVNVKGVAATTLLLVEGFSGLDTVTAGSLAPATSGGKLTGIAGTLFILNASTTSTLKIDDSGDTTARTVTLDALLFGPPIFSPFPIPEFVGHLNGLSMPGEILYRFKDVNGVTINGGSGGNTFNVDQTPAAPPPSTTTINTGGGADTVNLRPNPGITYQINGGNPAPPTFPGDTLNVNTTGTTSPAVTSTFTATGFTGQWTFADRAPVKFAEIETGIPNSGGAFSTPTATGTATTTATPTATTTSTAAASTPTSTATATSTPTTPTQVNGNLRLVVPVRAVDTRASDVPGGIATTGFTPAGTNLTAGQLADGSITRYLLAGKTFGGVAVPADTTAVLLNVTSIQGIGSGGFITVYPGDAPAAPNASTLNPSTPLAANFTTVGLSGGTIAIKSVGAPRDLAIDLVGFYAPSNPAGPGNLRLLPPARVLDTRIGPSGPIGFDAAGNPLTPATTGPILANTTRTFTLAGKTLGTTTFPTDVSGILAHVTTVQPVGTGGFVTLLPGAGVGGRPNSSTVNPFTPIAFNGAAVGVPTAGAGTGQFSLFSSTTLDVVVDVIGYWAGSNTVGLPGVVGNPTLVTPARVLDTRSAPFGPIGFNGNGSAVTAGQLPAGATRQYRLGGQSFPSGLFLPSDVKGVLANVTLVQGAAGGGFVTVYAGDQTLPDTSTVNPATSIASSFWANALAQPPSTPAGTVNVTSVGDNRDVLIDILAYFR